MTGSTPVASAISHRLTHYILVRRDLPFGVLCAMVAHAAGESFYLLASSSELRAASDAHALVADAGGIPASPANLGPGSSVEERSSNGEVGGSYAIPGHHVRLRSSVKEQPGLTGRSLVQVQPEAPPQATVVVLGARNEQRLLALEARLLAAGVPHVAIREPDAPWDNQLMAIGLVPAPRGKVADHVRGFHMLPG